MCNQTPPLLDNTSGRHCHMAHMGDFCAHPSAKMAPMQLVYFQTTAIEMKDNPFGSFTTQPGRITPHILYAQVSGCITFIVHVGRHLHHAEAEVDRQVIKVIIRLQDKLSSELHAVPIFIHLVYQHGVEILVLYGRKYKTLVSQQIRVGDIVEICS